MFHRTFSKNFILFCHFLYFIYFVHKFFENWNWKQILMPFLVMKMVQSNDIEWNPWFYNDFPLQTQIKFLLQYPPLKWPFNAHNKVQLKSLEILGVLQLIGASLSSIAIPKRKVLNFIIPILQEKIMFISIQKSCFLPIDLFSISDGAAFAIETVAINTATTKMANNLKFILVYEFFRDKC